MDKVAQLDAAISTLLRLLVIQERQLSSDIATNPFNPLDLETLSYVSDNPRAPAKEIATYLRISPTTMQSIVDRLEKRGYIIKDKNALKGRSIAISLTPDGIQFRNLMRAHNIKNCELMLSALDPEDQNKFVDSLAKIATKVTSLG